MKPLIPIPDGISIESVIFPLRKIHISNHHSEGYWLIFRKEVWHLDHPFYFFVKLSNGMEYRIEIEAGFLTDLASTPKALWWLFPPWDEKWGCAALGHDILYAAEVFPRAVNDAFLRAGMRVCGASEFEQDAFFNAVRHWGWLTYRAHTRESVMSARAQLDIRIINLV